MATVKSISRAIFKETGFTVIPEDTDNDIHPALFRGLCKDGSWGSMLAAGQKDIGNGRRAFLVFTDNPSYYKADGQKYLTSLWILNEETNSAWLLFCLTSYRVSEMATQGKNVTHFLSKDIAAEEVEKQKSYPWQFHTVVPKSL